MLVSIYVAVIITSLILFFIKKDWPARYKKWLIYAHVSSLLLLVLDLYLGSHYGISIRSAQADLLIPLLFMISGTLLFSLFRSTMTWPGKIYFGLFLLYPLLVSFLYSIGRMLLAIILAIPLITTLVVPDTYYADSRYEIRGVFTVLDPRQFVLVEKQGIIEKETGITCENLEYSHYQQMRIISQTKDAITVSFSSGKQETILKFQKQF